ncbi:hypothetical protein BGZ76_003646 [Entomortierella beljakovae]|nr:hypothetical protein BGZ76_003646 [Entomortierella beljakovae]
MQNAQNGPSVPEPVTAMAYITLDERTLYIKNGKFRDGSASYDFYSLDLTVDWDASNLPWKSLDLGSGLLQPPPSPHRSLVVSPDKKSLTFWGIENGFFIYDIASNTWVKRLDSPPNTTRWGGLHAVGSPYTGLIYIPSGADEGASMLVFDPAKNSSRTVAMPQNVKGVSNYSVNWDTMSGTLILFGGEFYDQLSQKHVPNEVFYRYSPDTGNWTIIKDSGPHIPTPGVNHSRAGSMMILYGGWTLDGRTLDSIFFLDPATMQWTKGPEISPTQRRGGMACSVSGDNFIVWGGDMNSTNMEAYTTPIIYNLRTGQWTSKFVSLSSSISASSTPASPDSTSSPGPTTGTKSISKAAIGGIIAGLAIIIAAAVAFASFHYKKKRSSKDLDADNLKRSPSTRGNKGPEFTSISIEGSGQVRSPALIINRSPHVNILNRTVTSFGDAHVDGVPSWVDDQARNPQDYTDLPNFDNSGYHDDFPRRAPNNPHTVMPEFVAPQSDASFGINNLYNSS